MHDSFRPIRASAFSFLRPGLLGLFVLITVYITAGVRAAEEPEFAPDVKLAPFVVRGEALSISIHARSKSDRRYAEKFAEDVIAVAHETLERSTGRGLVIVGKDGEPHPLRVFQRFCELAEKGELDPSLASATDTLVARQNEFRARFQGGGNDGAAPIDYERVLEAVPVPLDGLGSKLFQIAWAEKFDVARVDEKFRTLTQADLAKDKFADFHWVFYLPPKEASDRALKNILSSVMKHEKMGLLKRAAIRSALVVMRPSVKKAIESLRKGMLFRTVLQARSNDSVDDVEHLTRAYVQVLMPDFKLNGNTEHARAVEAVETQKRANAAYAADPFLPPTRLAVFTPDDYTAFVGSYAAGDKAALSFQHAGDHFLWQYRDHTPRVFYPAGPRLLVDEKALMTIEFQLDEAGAVTAVEERQRRQRKTFQRFQNAK